MNSSNSLNSLALMLDRSNLMEGFDVSNPLTNGQKWVLALFFGLLFLIIASPIAFYISNSVAVEVGVPRMYNFPSDIGPTMIGVIIQSIIFAIVIRLLLW
jgi:hypothetical protein